MPLDGHTYLVNQGWGGKGKALREGALSRPLAIPQKKTLAGLGKDRDEAFPFWDHLFLAAAKSIQVKCSSDDEDSADSNPERTLALKRTSTGILSTRRPVEGTPATSSGSSTPLPQTETSNPKLSLIATAKRDAAKRGLYSRFFRGPMLGPEPLVDEERRLLGLVSQALAPDSLPQDVTAEENLEVGMADRTAIVNSEVVQLTEKKRRKSEDESQLESEEARTARKRQRKEQKHAKRRAKEESKAVRKERKARKWKQVTEREQKRQVEPALPDVKPSKKSKNSSSDPQNCESQQAPTVEKKKKKRKRDDLVEIEDT
ncbi:hypothetical protein CPB83DRAFT_903181 [Crepidotus variabilis]|uniref:Uncharacterized protein n=1 Tax=Crepidotus variabilis TaxID=179855 RepID=A0A9P6EPW0_9AGAR|nr:hypothetical protein CPB83DRAFT_903181 [Crepidotus variabilis]